MPARSVIFEKRDTAMAVLGIAMVALSDRFGVEIPPELGYEGRDQEFNRARELERIAGFVQAVAEASSPFEAELQSVRTNLAEALDRGHLLDDQVREANEKLHRLFTICETDEMVRDSLVEAGWLEAKQDEGGTDWSFVVLGVTDEPDELNAERAELKEEGEDSPEPDAEDVPKSLDNLTRAQLNELAEKLGIEGADAMANKAAVIAAIQERPR